VFVTTGISAITVQTGLSYTSGQSIVIWNSLTQYMEATVNYYTSNTGELGFTAVKAVGSGLHNSWTVNLNGASGTSGSSGSSGTSGVSSVWANTGTTIQSVGWSGTTSAPTVGTTFKNNLSYYQIGSKLWQVVMSFQTNGSGANAGSGDYLFTLPNGLSFDTTKPWQSIYTGSVGASDIVLAQNTIPSGTGMISDYGTSTSSDFQPVVWDATHFRLLVHLPGSTIRCMGSGFWQVTASYGMNVTFQFTSL
jgi:hypothetical protein